MKSLLQKLRVAHQYAQGIAQLDSVNERDVPPIPPLFLPRPNLAVNGDTVLQKLKDRPDGMFLDRCVAFFPPLLGPPRASRCPPQSVPCRCGKLGRRGRQQRAESSRRSQQRGQ